MPVASSRRRMLAPLALYAAAVMLLVAAMLAASHFIGERHRDLARGEAYESGVAPTGSARGPLSVKFYVIAMLFVIFDLEIVFLLTWSVAAKKLGWFGYAEVALFVFVLGTALAYLWREGALDWTNSSRLESATPARTRTAHGGRAP